MARGDTDMVNHAAFGDFVLGLEGLAILRARLQGERPSGDSTDEDSNPCPGPCGSLFGPG